MVFLSGPEGGLSPTEDALARTAGWQPVTLGGRILRAETAALGRTGAGHRRLISKKHSKKCERLALFNQEEVGFLMN